MKTYIYGLITFFLFIFLHEILSIREGFVCFSSEEQVAMNNNNIKLKKVQSDAKTFLDNVTKIENEVKGNSGNIIQNVDHNLKILSAVSDKKYKNDKKKYKAETKSKSTPPNRIEKIGIQVASITPDLRKKFKLKLGFVGC